MNGTTSIPALPSLQILPLPQGPYQTRIGASGPTSGGNTGLNFPVQQYQEPKTKTSQDQPASMTTPGQALSSGAGQLQSSVQQAMQIYQWRQNALNGPNGTPLAMNSNPGGVWYGNPQQLQVGPPGPGQSADAFATSNPASSTASSGAGPGTGSGPMASAGGMAGMGVASALGALSSAFGQVSARDAQLAANPPKPTVTGQPFTTFQFTPFLGGGSLV